jgi:hypothetical protein
LVSCFWFGGLWVLTALESGAVAPGVPSLAPSIRTNASARARSGGQGPLAPHTNRKPDPVRFGRHDGQASVAAVANTRADPVIDLDPRRRSPSPQRLPPWPASPRTNVETAKIVSIEQPCHINASVMKRRAF